MVLRALSVFSEEYVWSSLDEDMGRVLEPIVSELNRTGLLGLYIKIACSGKSIWRSSLPRNEKRSAKEFIRSREDKAVLVLSDPERLVDMAVTHLTKSGLATEILKKVDHQYFIDELRQIAKDTLD